MKKLLVLAFAGLLLALPSRALAQKTSPDGEWAMTVNTDNGPISATLVLKVDGEKASGTVKGEQGDLPFEGTFKEKTLTISFLYPTPDGNSLTVTMTGTIDGDSISGTFDAGGMMSGTWTAKKTK